jgi:large subunit ribosomal protein L24
MKLKIKKGDIVEVIAGNDKGARGRVLILDVNKKQVLVESVNVRKKHQRPNQQNQKGGIMSKEMPIDYSNVQLLDSDKNPTRVGIRHEEKNEKLVPVRFALSNGKDL